MPEEKPKNDGYDSIKTTKDVENKMTELANGKKNPQEAEKGITEWYKNAPENVKELTNEWKHERSKVKDKESKTKTQSKDAGEEQDGTKKTDDAKSGGDKSLIELIMEILNRMLLGEKEKKEKEAGQSIKMSTAANRSAPSVPSGQSQGSGKGI